jgi:hypothetical protein
MSSGEEKCWQILSTLDPQDVCKRAIAEYHSIESVYTLNSFGMKISISLKKRNIFSSAPHSETLIKKLGYFSRLAFLRYLTDAKDIPLSEKLTKPSDLKGGHIFFRGTHTLPLQRVADVYERDIKSFYDKAKQFDAERLNYGDCSVRLFPLPRIPVVLILWSADDEFPTRLDLLLDTSCEHHLPLDIIWSIAMMSLLIML